MAKGLDDLINWLVEETAYAGEKGQSVAEFVAAVSRFSSRQQRRRARHGDRHGEKMGAAAAAAYADGLSSGETDMQLARKAWEWLMERPEILVGRGEPGSKGLSLDDVLALPEPVEPPLPVEAADKGKDKKKAPAKGSAASKRASTAATPPTSQLADEQAGTRPRLYATEQTIWYTITGHDVDYKKIPPLEWKCLMGIASAKEHGILQGDLRALVNQDKRSVPKRTDFLATKGYAIKRTTIARGYRTSMLWLTEFAPVELPEAEDPSMTTSGGIDFSAAFLTKDLEPVPWRNRWTGESIEFASFGQTILAVTKAWGVIRLVDLKQKLGIHSRPWHMRTLARSCREFVASGVLRYVAAVRQDERRLFKDCIKYERDPTKEEWAIYLAAGRKRIPMTELRAKQKRQLLRGTGGDDDDMVDDEDDEDGGGGSGVVGIGSALLPSWVPEKPLANLIYDTVRQAGPRGMTSPDICKATVGASFGRYMFSLMADLAKLGNQPEHLGRFQLRSAPVRTGKNNAYVFVASGMEEEEAQRSSTASQLVSERSDADPVADLSRRFGFATRPDTTARQAEGRTLSELAGSVSTQGGSQRRHYHHRTIGRRQPMAGKAAQRKRQPHEGDETEAVNSSSANPPRKRGRPRKIPAPSEVEAPAPQPDEPDEPYVMVGEPGSLNQGLKVDGRPKRSIVLVAKLDKLKDGGFLEGGRGYKAAESLSQEAAPAAVRRDWRAVLELGDSVVPEQPRREETPAAEVDAVAEVSAPGAVLSQYNGSPGRLTVDTSSMRLLFSFDRNTASKASDKAPLTIAVGSIVGDPSIRDAPGGAGEALVLQAREGDGRQESEPVWPFVFILDGADGNHQKAIALCSRLTELRKAPEDDKDDDETEDGDVGDDAATAGTAASGRKRGRGLKKGKSTSGPKEYSCEKCGGKWKNLLGLQYHQTKARTSCNPNYAPPPIMEIKRKTRERRDKTHDREGDGSSLLSSPSAGRVRGESMGPARRLFGGSSRAVAPRGIVRNPALAVDRRTEPASSEKGDRPLEGENGQTDATTAAATAATAAFIRRRELESSSLEGEVANIDPRLRTPQVPKASMLPTGSVQFPLAAATAAAAAAARSSTPASKTASKTERLDGSSAASLTGFQMPLVRVTTRMTSFMLRSTRVAEIVKHLLRSSGGVFPSDRSLWYAVFGVYTKSFPGEDPPTLNVSRAVMKKLEAAKAVEEHTFGFRDAKGHFIYLRLLVSSGEDPKSDAARAMRQRMQESHPQPYVPAEFAPSDKDMAVLRVYDKEAAAKAAAAAAAAEGADVVEGGGGMGGAKQTQRGRRSLASEIEVLNAPFYEHAATAQPYRPGRNGAYIVNYGGGGEDDEGVTATATGASGKGGSSGGGGSKRKAIGKDVGSSAKKRRKTARFADYITGKAEEDDWREGEGERGEGGEGGEGEEGGEMEREMETERARRKRRGQLTGEEDGEDVEEVEVEDEEVEDEDEENDDEDEETDEDVDMDRGEDKNDRDGRRLPTSVFDGLTSIRFLVPNTRLGDEVDEMEGGVKGMEDSMDYNVVDSQISHRVRLRHVTFTNLVVLRATVASLDVWPALSDGFFEKQADSQGVSFTMNGWLPGRTERLRDSLPQTVAECEQQLRGSVRIGRTVSTAAGRFFRDVERCRLWEMSLRGHQLLASGATVAPEHVFLHVSFSGEHRLATGSACPVLRWSERNQFGLASVPSGTPEEGERGAGGAGWSGRGGASGWGRGGGWGRGWTAGGRAAQLRQATYLASSRRELTGYPQTERDYLRGRATTTLDWSADETLIAAFVAIKTLIGGLSQAVDWGLLMRLFPERKLSGLRAFWSTARRERAAVVDGLAERFQQAFPEAYGRGELAAVLDYNNVLAYDWAGLVAWTLRLMRRGEADALPATREQLEGEYVVGGGQPQPLSSWREDYYHPTRSVWNRLQDAAGEAAVLSLDGPGLSTPAEAAAAMEAARAGGRAEQAAAARSALRHLVARSWLRALCATPHERYRPSRIKQKLLTLGAVGGDERQHSESPDTINRQLQAVIGELQNERVLRRTKSMVALGGRMYLLAEAYASTLDKAAQQDKFRQAAAFKRRLDHSFRADQTVELSPSTNDDGMVMALLNLQAHGRVAVEAIDAPCVPFGFEPGNYETRKFPKHYQRFRQRVVPTERYVYGEDEDEDEDGERLSLMDAPAPGPHGELPMWRDFFGVLDRSRFVRLASAVVFSMATRGGAVEPRQTAAHLRPVLEPFEVQMLIDWAVAVGILERGGGDECTVWHLSEWWWLLIGRMYEGLDGEETTASGEKGEHGEDGRGEDEDEDEDEMEVEVENEKEKENEDEDEDDGDEGPLADVGRSSRTDSWRVICGLD